jgi:pyridoxal phosphate enzyme (YggS family)
VTSAIDPERVRIALARVRHRIVAAGGDAGVEVLAVTKGFGADAVTAALAAGCRAIGENYAQELLAKRDAAAAAEVHFIGQLQTNKVRQLASVVDVFETVDRARLAAEIGRRAPGATVLIQVDTTGEAGKGGCPIDELDGLVEAVTAAGLDLRGLMTVGPTGGGAQSARPGFRRVRSEVDRLGLSVCSMGMSDDLEIAVEEGSTQVRVGSSLFGPRDR